MATLTTQIFEILTLNGDNVGSSVTTNINNINYVDNRILSVPTGSVTTLFSMDANPGAGTFVTSSIQYVRISNGNHFVQHNGWDIGRNVNVYSIFYTWLGFVYSI